MSLLLMFGVEYPTCCYLHSKGYAVRLANVAGIFFLLTLQVHHQRPTAVMLKDTLRGVADKLCLPVAADAVLTVTQRCCAKIHWEELLTSSSCSAADAVLTVRRGGCPKV